MGAPGASGGGNRDRMRYQGAMNDDRLTRLEETTAHLTRLIEDLSEVVARQDGEIALLRHRLRMLMERAAERELEAGANAPLADRKPPHW